jgi:hypothetical protein
MMPLVSMGLINVITCGKYNICQMLIVILESEDYNQCSHQHHAKGIGLQCGLLLQWLTVNLL